MKKQLTAVIILAAVALIAGWLLFKNKPSSKTGPNANQPAAAAPTNNPIKFTGQAKIEMAATVPAGASVTINTVLMPGNGFVVIKDKTGKVIGASNLIVFPETENFKMAVELKSGQAYVAELHGDNGNGVFDPQTDPAIVINGKTFTANFKVK